MERKRPVIASITATAILLAGSGLAAVKAQGWATKVDQAALGVQGGGGTNFARDTEGTRGSAPLGLFASERRERGEGRGRRPPADDQIIRFPVKSPENPGRSEFSHLRHFNALGDKQCKTCHSPEMGLLTSPAYASRVTDPALEPHGPKSLGRFCGSCHNGTTRLSQVGVLRGRPDAPIFTTAQTGDPTSCNRCHAPRDHGSDFTSAHARLAERRGTRACLACHAQAWGPADRQLQAELLAAERTLKANPDDPKAALAVGPNNFCVYCHRTDAEWRGD